MVECDVVVGAGTLRKASPARDFLRHAATSERTPA